MSLLSQGTFDLILHAGQHKTGTSAIQRFLRARRAGFLKRGIFVPETGMAWNGSHHMLIERLAGYEPIGQGQQLLTRELAGISQQKVLISAESAKKAIVEGRGELLIDRLCAAGARHVTILLYLRSPFALANAVYSQRTVNLVLDGASFEEFLERLCCETYFDYGRILALAERPDVTLVARPYSSDVRAGAVHDFLLALGLNWPIPREPRVNTSYGPIALAAMRELGIDVADMPRAQKTKLVRRLFRMGRSADEAPFWAIDDAVKARLAGPDAETEAFSQSVWGRPWRDAIGEEQRPLNLFDLNTASVEQRALYDRLIGEMREAAAPIRAQLAG